MNNWLKRHESNVVDSQIKRIMNTFDFEHLQKCIVALNGLIAWKFIQSPTVEQLRADAEAKLRQVAADKSWCSVGQECGHGFNATKLPDGELVLDFSIELWREQR